MTDETRVTLLGTSHISQESIEKVKRYMKGKDCVCVELDPLRYQALLRGDRSRPPGIFSGILHFIQQRLGKATGIQPGHDMLTAVEEAEERGLPVYLIDRDIRATTAEIGDAPLLEKISLFIPVLRWNDIDLGEVPSEEMIKEVLTDLEEKSPTIYDILVTKRNRHMAEWIDKVGDNHDDILVVIGAAHSEGLETLLKDEFKVRVV